MGPPRISSTGALTLSPQNPWPLPIRIVLIEAAKIAWGKSRYGRGSSQGPTRTYTDHEDKNQLFVPAVLVYPCLSSRNPSVRRAAHRRLGHHDPMGRVLLELVQEVSHAPLEDRVLAAGQGVRSVDHLDVRRDPFV